MRRELQLRGDVRFERLAGISMRQIYNLYESRAYQRLRVTGVNSEHRCPPNRSISKRASEVASLPPPVPAGCHF